MLLSANLQHSAVLEELQTMSVKKKHTEKMIQRLAPYFTAVSLDEQSHTVFSM